MASIGSSCPGGYGTHLFLFKSPFPLMYIISIQTKFKKTHRLRGTVVCEEGQLLRSLLSVPFWADPIFFFRKGVAILNCHDHVSWHFWLFYQRSDEEGPTEETQYSDAKTLDVIA